MATDEAQRQEQCVPLAIVLDFYENFLTIDDALESQRPQVQVGVF